MGLFTNKPKKLKPRKITLAQAIEYAKNPVYNEHYEFIPIDPEDIKAGYIPRLKKELSREPYDYNITYESKSDVKENKDSKRNQSFIDRIRVEVNQNKTEQNIEQGILQKIEAERPKYGDYKSAKKYKGDIR